jgi:hypothetical protein
LSWSDESTSHFRDDDVFIHVDNVIYCLPVDDFGKPYADQGGWQAVIASVGLTPGLLMSLRLIASWRMIVSVVSRSFVTCAWALPRRFGPAVAPASRLRWSPNNCAPL